MSSEVEKVLCSMCGALILPATAAKTGSVCMPCLPRFHAKTLKLSEKEQQLFQTFWAKLHESGWLDELTDHDRENLRLDLLNIFDSGEGDPAELLVTGFIADESIEDDGDYVALIQKFAKASRGIFTPSNLTDQFNHDAEEATVSFEFCGSRYEITVPFKNDDFHPDVIHLLNEALEDAGIQQRFFPLFGEDNPGVSILFVSEKTWSNARRLGILRE
jgi:hypothetical protein